MSESKSPISVLFVCMGNICRSPTAEGVFRKHVEEAGLADRIVTDSAGTHAYHIGNPPDRRAQSAASERGYDLGDIRARRVEDSDFLSYEYIIAMDRENMKHLSAMRPSESRADLRLFLEYARDVHYDEVPDPYYGGARGFQVVLNLVENASAGFLQVLRRRI